jgi:rubrerythrin
VTKVIPDSARRLLANHWPFEVLLENGKTVHCAEGQPKALHPCRYCQGEGKRDMDRFDSWLKNRPLTINGTDYYAHFNGQRYYVRRARGARSLRSAAVGIGGALYAMENHRHEENAGPQVVSFTLRDPEEKSPWDCDVCGYPRRERSCPACA